ncbi:hypothetical protein CJD_A0055 [Clostridium perfringens D str. JGS1721]|uniref:Uncharacterized protein n=1 Tax=Clostridium perfringens D str. JGS1721 TaxID=488537 RepID=B1V860_CLOPF|nr:hypothetical protein [Clostridium perfringens]EDT70001.1 hypothetical protein CJD_A0055 [Clostridium perfringens D str. JGS1721]
MENIYSNISKDITDVIKRMYLKNGLTDELIYLSRSIDKLNNELKKQNKLN